MDDLISRQAAIDVLWKALHEYEDKMEKAFIESDELDVEDWVQHRIFAQNMNDIDRQTILNLPSAQPERSWIPVTERLPEIGEIVLAYVDELRLIIRAKIVDAKDYRGERRIDWARVDPDPFFLSCYTITHWMPLPDPPKEET